MSKEKAKRLCNILEAKGVKLSDEKIALCKNGFHPTKALD